MNSAGVGREVVTAHPARSAAVTSAGLTSMPSSPAALAELDLQRDDLHRQLIGQASRQVGRRVGDHRDLLRDPP